MFFRNPFSVDENVIVNVSSPSSSKYASVADLGAPEAAAQRVQQQVRGGFVQGRELCAGEGRAGRWLN